MVIGRGRRIEHPKDTSKGSRDLRSLRMLRNFRLRTLKGTPKDMAQLPDAHAQNIVPDRVISGHVTDVTSGHVTSGHVTSGHVTSGCSPLLPLK